MVRATRRQNPATSKKRITAKQFKAKMLGIRTSKKSGSASLGNTPPRNHMAKRKAKPSMKCGDDGTYGDLQKKNGQNKYDRDHIPSKAALKEKAKQLKMAELSPAQERAIDQSGLAIAIPKKAHSEVSPTYGGRNDPVGDAKQGLEKSAKRDIDAMKDEIDKYEPGCKAAYEAAAKKILAMTEADYVKALTDILKKVK